MKLKFKYYCLSVFLFISILSYSQQNTNNWRALFSVGINSPSQDGFIEPFLAKDANFPTINLGIQHLFNSQLGARLDFGYHRFVNADTAPEFKINYTRVNVQLVYDAFKGLSFLPTELGLVWHAGPGYSIIKPLGNYKENKHSYLNVMAGVELNYSISRAVSLFVDGSYIKGFSKDFYPIAKGTGSFNGDLLTITFGASVSLMNCRTCN